MLTNLKAEIARGGIKKGAIAKTINCSGKTLSNKINGETKFSIDEAFRIKNKYFPNYSIEYLFSPTENQAS